MLRSACRQLAELRSAYLDGALADHDRERVLSHLVNCAGCRHDVDELRTLRQLLNQMGSQPDVTASPDALSSRLVSIAGHDAYSPVWSRPFRRTRMGALPSNRHTVRMRTTVAALAFGTVVSTLGGIGYAAAPPLEVAPMADPSDRVRSEFASTLSQFPLASTSKSALMMAPNAQLSSSSTQLRSVADEDRAAQDITRDAAVDILHRAGKESDEVSYSGTQTVVSSAAGQTTAATVQIAFQPGQGSDVKVFSRSGNQVLNGFVPAFSSSRMADSKLISLLLRNYLISGWTGSKVAGRPASVVEASATDVGGGSHPVARWWVDDATGLVLWHETYDASGAVALAAGFTSVSVGGTPVFMDHLAPRLAVSTTTASLTLSNASDLASRGWSCQNELAGLALVRLRSDAAADPGALHMVYSDGVSTLSVFQQRGRLSGPPTGSRWDDAIQAHVHTGTPRVATWQSGGTVFTVVTDGSAELVANAVASLPHREPLSRTTMEQVRAGWEHIVEQVIG